MKKLVFIPLLALLITTLSLAQSTLSVRELRCFYQVNPLGVEARQPKLSWQLASEKRGARQTAYRIVVTTESDKKEQLMWDSGKVTSDQSLHIPYAGKPLQSGQVYQWKIMAWDGAGKPSRWSEKAHWQMGLLADSDWKGAKWLALSAWNDSARIVPGIHRPHSNPKYAKRQTGLHPLPLFRREIDVKKDLERATFFVSGLGQYELSLNGRNVNDHFLAPGWTNYGDYAYYNTLDLTAQLKKGKNALGVSLGNGFYNIPNERYRKLIVAYGAPKWIGRLVLLYKDGSTEEIISDERWRATAGPVTFTSIFGGEDYDATRVPKGWDQVGFDDATWHKPIVAKGEKLRAQIGYPMAVLDTFPAVRRSQPRPGVWVFDMGQNASAIPYVVLTGSKQARVKMTPSELINDDGLVNQEASGKPHVYTYTLLGEGSEAWRPQFTYYGFRYIQVEGAVPAGEPNPDALPELVAIQSLHVRNSAPPTGTFTCSNELFNQTNELIRWAIKSNMAHVLTDCPHREKLGWLEQTYLMGAATQFNFDMALLNEKMLWDMKSAQLANGLVPDIVPEYVQFEGGFRDSPEWGSAAVILPWYTYQWYGDRQILIDHYELMTRYVAYLGTKASDHMLMHGLGDWFDMGPGPMGRSQLTPVGLTPTATYFYDAVILSKIARLLGKADDAASYAQLAQAIRTAFNRTFYHPETKTYGSGSQTASAMALYMGLVEDAERTAVYRRFVEKIKEEGYVLTAGDIGFYYVVNVLTAGGDADVLFRMNNRQDVPGYGFQLAHGATALTESWPALRIVSNNHLMLGHLMEWFYEGIGGIRQAAGSVGYKELRIEPQFPGDLTSANVSYQTPYGMVKTAWQRQGDAIELDLQVPVNVTAQVKLPVGKVETVREGGIPIAQVVDCRRENDSIHIGSGRYRFSFRYVPPVGQP